MNRILQFLYLLPRVFAVKLINLYQATLSPDHGWFKARHPYGYCRHYPSCSEYSKQAIVKFGLLKGAWLGAKRLARCNPFVKPSVDLIPNS